jgi:hypothetical protein
MSERSVRVNDPPAGVTDTGLGMTFAFKRSVDADAFGRSAGADEQAVVISIVAEAMMATIEFSVFKGRLFDVYKKQFSGSAGNPVG